MTGSEAGELSQRQHLPDEVNQLQSNSITSRHDQSTVVRRLKKIFVVALSFVSVAMLPVLYNTERRYYFAKTVFTSRSFNQSSNDTYDLSPTSWPFTTVQQQQQRKLIVAWTRFFGNDLPGLSPGTQSFEELGCEETNCEYSNDRGRAGEADAVIFHMRDFRHGDVPKVRHKHQRYVFYLLESPIHTFNNLKGMTRFFNWTATYRTDSDIYSPYGFISNLTYDQGRDYMGARGSNTTTMAWVVSNCNTQSRRESLVTLLRYKYHLAVDIFGGCSQGQNACGDKSVRSSCPDLVESRYLFYLSLENSLCRDYLTEKFFNYIQKDIIPVVLTGANYTKLVPESAVISLPHGGNLAQVVNKIKKLSHDRKLYNKHFEWRRGFRSRYKNSHAWCKLCEKLNDPSEPEKSYEDIHGWWMSGACEKSPYWT